MLDLLREKLHRLEVAQEIMYSGGENPTWQKLRELEIKITQKLIEELESASKNQGSI